jgi:hypothetical protein
VVPKESSRKEEVEKSIVARLVIRELWEVRAETTCCKDCKE